MDCSKTEILKCCRDLLQKIKCDVVVDINERQLFNVLFQSEVKKKMLLTWLLQQVYPPEACSNSATEDLVAIFIPACQYKNFINGTMPVVEQYQKWKLIMSTLYQQQLGRSITNPPNYEKELLQGVLLDKYERIWNEKLEFNQNFNYSIIEKTKRINFNELDAEVKQARNELQEWKLEEKRKEVLSSNVENEQFLNALDEYKNFIEKLNEKMNKEELHFISQLKGDSSILRYQDLNNDSIKNMKERTEILNQSILTMNKILGGVESVPKQVEERN